MAHWRGEIELRSRAQMEAHPAIGIRIDEATKQVEWFWIGPGKKKCAIVNTPLDENPS
ncbi:MAG: hypothetical protein LBF51_10380 [Zoogloeaceae bacterium]|jgi:hypothetical protein|nr:hypothetical protein [Zoogloeaceae bacterium]